MAKIVMNGREMHYATSSHVITMLENAYSKHQPGKLLVFEGMDATGKSTFIRKLQAQDSRFKLIETPRKPGSVGIDFDFEDWLIAEVQKASGKILMLDRSVLSNIAYNMMRKMLTCNNSMYEPDADWDAWEKLTNMCNTKLVVLLRSPRAYTDDHIELTLEQDAYLASMYACICCKLHVTPYALPVEGGKQWCNLLYTQNNLFHDIMAWANKV